MRPARVFYASGARGKSVHTSGDGKPLARGWYAHNVARGGYNLVVGPFKTKTEANLKAFGSTRP